ncbi:hypothetical protein ACQPX6_01165 [Actinomycetospora sp. CA-101289]|uniref:hypothetical protein n=1 Tax=Actinomycetospora sp. CA-101289 TaxID=3239893 RepID=UPI003D99A550
MSSPGGPARASGPRPDTAGTDASASTGSSATTHVDTLRPVPDPPADAAPFGAGAWDDDDEDDDGPDPADGEDFSWSASPDPEPDTDAETATDTGTLRRSRPSRSGRPGTGVPTPPSPMNAATGPTPSTGPEPVAVPDPPRRPVPPTFPSPGQPPPGVARRQGRHARPESPGTSTHTPPSGYTPRHAAPDAETEQFAVTPYTGPGGVGPAPLTPAPAGVVPTSHAGHAAHTTDADSPALWTGPGVVIPPSVGAAGDPADAAGGDRVRVVLAERRVPTRAVRTVAEIEQQTETGELLLRNLLRSQLALGVRLGLVAVFVFGALPVIFLVLPRAGTLEVAGVTLPWLVLGLAPYPFMLALAWLYVRTAERNELDFADNVED